MRVGGRLWWIGLLAGTLGCGSVLHAQGYRAEVDARVRTIRFRGVELDSVPAEDVVTDATGAAFSRGGFAVQCVPGRAFCTFFRPGPLVTGGPLTVTGDMTAWGFGVPGLRVRVRGRVGTDLGSANVWPGTEPALELIEGYAEYVRNHLTARVGRSYITSRLGYTGYDGVYVGGRLFRERLTVAAFGGWGLARAAAVPVTSPALNPLDEFQPSTRQLVGGVVAAWRAPRLRLRTQYQREVDPRTDQFVAERMALDAVVRPVGPVRVTAGADIDLAAGTVGSAELTALASVWQGRVAIRGGARRYRPHFDLWTIWGAFSPVAYHAAFAGVTARASAALRVHSRIERYAFDETDAETPFTQPRSDGWRWRTGVQWTPTAGVAADLAYAVDRGPGAAALGIDAALWWQPWPTVTVRGHLSRLFRSLEFRFSDSDVWLYGVDGELRMGPDLTAHVGVAYHDETRDRLGAAAFAWDQVRVRAGFRARFRSRDERRSLPPEVLRMPPRPVEP